MSDGALSQDDINKIISGEIDFTANIKKNDDISSDDMNLLLNAIMVINR